MTSTSTCSTASLLSRNVTITYGAIYALFLIIVSVYSFNFLMKYSPKFIKSSKTKRFKMWILDAWKRRKCYIPIIAHIFDQITDVSVAIQFYILGTTKSNEDWSDCNGLNMWYLFVLTVLSMLIYRLISASLIYQSTKSIQRFFIQILDFELLRALYINYLCNNTEPCDPQRWITTLEATFESTPQALIQLLYLVKTNTFSSSYLVVISFLSSLICIISKLVSDDKSIVIIKAKKLNFKFERKCISLFYMLRFIWRIFDISSQIFLMTLIWIAMGGVILTIKVVIESFLLLVICITTKQWELLFAIIAIVVSTTTDELKNISIGIGIYRNVTNIIFMILISIWFYVDFECLKCTEYVYRKTFVDNSVIFTIFIYTWIAVFVSPICIILLIKYNVFKSQTSTSR
eukprot:121139_1